MSGDLVDLIAHQTPELPSQSQPALLTLGIETSCDETSAAILDGRALRSNVIVSQLEHSLYGGVVPELASRAHVRKIVPVIQEALRSASVTLAELEGIAVTKGPGLVGSLIVGVNTAKGIALATGKPLFGVHHLEGHIFSNLIEDEIDLPFLALLVSGGHTELVHVAQLGRYQVLGRTLDDAAGEAFDKVAKLLDLLPGREMVMGGRAVAESAESGGDALAVSFPRAMGAADSLDFSFSGLKTAVLHCVDKVRASREFASQVPDIAASFQAAVVDVLVAKTERAMTQTGVRRVALAGGVAANVLLRSRLRAAVESLQGRLYFPPPILCTDNAAMIAAAGQFHLRRGEHSGLKLDATPRLPL